MADHQDDYKQPLKSSRATSEGGVFAQYDSDHEYESSGRNGNGSGAAAAAVDLDTAAPAGGGGGGGGAYVSGTGDKDTSRLLGLGGGARVSSKDGKPVNILTQICSFIIVTEFAERLAYYGLQGSLVLWLTRRGGLSTASADMHTSLWNGTAYVTPLLGGYLADTVFGRYKAIMVFICIYLVGLCGITVASQEHIDSVPLFFLSLYVVALGTGGIKPNVSTLGADQYDDSIPEQATAKASFFNYFYASINCGAFFSYTLVAWLCQSVSFSIGYAVPTMAITLSIVIFWSGRNRYKKLPPGGSALSTFLSVVWEAAWTNRKRPAEHWLDRASELQGGSFSPELVQEAKYVTRLCPFLALLVCYWAVYSTMTTLAINQACVMDLVIGSGSSKFVVPAAALNLFNTGVIIVFIPIFDKVVFPCMKRCGMRLTMLKKIGLGFVAAILAMVAAALIEMWRLHLYHQGEMVNHEPVCDDGADAPRMVDLSVFWQIPFFCLVGISEILASVTSLEFFYVQAPERMKSVCAALNLLTTAFGQWMTAVLIPIVNSNKDDEWIPHDPNHGHLDRYFWLLAGLMTINTFVFVWVAKDYEYKSPEGISKLEIEERDVYPPSPKTPVRTSAKGAAVRA